jgi:4-hydroxy-tetrahydrodipicolinate reductase
MRILLIGHGRMGQLVERLAPDYGCEIAGIVDEDAAPRAIEHGDFGAVTMAIDFSLAPAVPVNFPQLASRKLNVVIGTTGWQAHEAEMREAAARAGIGVLASANFSLGMQVFQLAVEAAAAKFAGLAEYGAWIHERHHAAKKDAPSGTALMLKSAMAGAGYGRPIDVSASRAGSAPGVHTVGFDGPSDVITLTHDVRDRAVFARGALAAANWLDGRRGWFSMRDMFGNSK